MINFDQVWSILDRSDPKKKSKKTAIFILSVNMTNFYSNIFWLVRKSNLNNFDQVWSILDRFDPKCDNFLYLQLFLLRNQIRSSLIHFEQIWSKKIKNKTAIFILSVNLATFYSNIFRLVRNQIWSSLIQFDPFWTDLIRSDRKKWKSDDIFQWLFHQKSNLIKFDPFWTDLIQRNQKQNSHFYPFCKWDNFL